MNDIDKVISNKYCVGCGSCQVENNVKLENEYGMYYPDIEDMGKLNSKVCPFQILHLMKYKYPINCLKILKILNFINILDIIWDYTQGMLKKLILEKRLLQVVLQNGYYIIY